MQAVDSVWGHFVFVFLIEVQSSEDSCICYNTSKEGHHILIDDLVSGFFCRSGYEHSSLFASTYAYFHLSLACALLLFTWPSHTV